MRVGLLGGSFDPPHHGHLTLARRCADALALARVRFEVAYRPPHKQDRPLTPYADRVALVRAAIAVDPRLELSTLEGERRGLSYTVDTLEQLRRAAPADRLWFLIGEDSLAELMSWRDPEGIAARARLGVYRRPGSAARVPPLFAGRVDFVDGPPIDISSSEIRARCRRGAPIADQLPPAVAALIRSKGLYRDA